VLTHGSTIVGWADVAVGVVSRALGLDVLTRMELGEARVHEEWPAAKI
jgi:hypothetical protein